MQSDTPQRQMTIILLTRACRIAPESAFHRTADVTILDAFILPRPAGDVLIFRDPQPLKAIYHPRSAAYAFVWNRRSYRVLTDIPGVPVPLELPSIATHAHWQTCKPCRDGIWCGEGFDIIVGARECVGVQWRDIPDAQ